MNTNMYLSRIAFVVSLSTAPIAASAADVVFNFNTDGVLPSSQGAIYQGEPPETSAYSVNNGLLYLNTFTIFSAAYQIPDIFNSNLGITIEWRARVVQTVGPDFGPGIALCSGPNSWTFGMTDTSIFEYAGYHSPDGSGWGLWRPAGSFSSGDFHAFKLVIPANSLNYDLFVDDVLQHSGTAAATDPSKNLSAGSFYWGEGLTDSGNRSLSEWDYVQIQNVPEPASIALLSIVGVMLIVGKRCGAAR